VQGFFSLKLFAISLPEGSFQPGIFFNFLRLKKWQQIFLKPNLVEIALANQKFPRHSKNIYRHNAKKFKKKEMLLPICYLRSSLTAKLG